MTTNANENRKSPIFNCLFLFSLCIFYGSSATAQIVHIPDENFKAALLANKFINTNSDGEIQVNEALDFSGMIIVNNQSISDLTGIESFVNLTGLKVHFNNLSSVNVSANEQIRELHIQNNQINSLDISSNPSLSMIRAHNNVLTSLDLSNNIRLRYLEVTNNKLSSLNVKNGKNYIMNKLDAKGNPNLNCIEVDHAGDAKANWSNSVDSRASFKVDCSESYSNIILGALKNNSLNLLVFPNPSTDYMRVSCDATVDEILVYSVNGQEMGVRFVSGEADIRHLHKGVYFLKASIGGETATVKIVKQ